MIYVYTFVVSEVICAFSFEVSTGTFAIVLCFSSKVLKMRLHGDILSISSVQPSHISDLLHFEKTEFTEIEHKKTERHDRRPVLITACYYYCLFLILVSLVSKPFYKKWQGDPKILMFVFNIKNLQHPVGKSKSCSWLLRPWISL